MHSPRLRFASALRAVFAVVVAVPLTACPAEEAECAAAADCGATTSTCAGCPDEVDAFCFDGACGDVEEVTVDVQGDLNLHRDVANDVGSVVVVLAHPDTASGPLSCDNAFDASSSTHIASGVNVIASSYRALSGGSYHPDLTFGRAPDAQVALLVVATADNAGEGAVLATGCDVDFISGSILNVDP